MLYSFIIERNRFLSKRTQGYHHTYYTGYNQPDNPNFLNTIKNTFNTNSEYQLNIAKNQVIDILIEDIPLIMEKNNWKDCICVSIPRAKSIHTYTDKQLYLIKAISEAASLIDGVSDGTNFVERHTNTKTTHLPVTTGRVTAIGQVDTNDGPSPYPGITKETCYIDKDWLFGENIILIDDIYTLGINIDEDCIQALYDAGAKNVVYYAVAYTKTRRN